MKNIVVLILVTGLFAGAQAQQGCALYSLQKGDLLNFRRIMPPPYDPAFAKLKPKDQVEYLKKQNEDIKNGTLKLKEGKMSIEITDKQPEGNGFVTKAKLTLYNPSGTYNVPYIYTCVNDTLYSAPEQQYSETEGVGVTFTGAVVFPLNMKKGDLLPDNKNITIGYKRNGSNTFLMPYVTSTTTTHYLDNDGSELYRTVERTYANKEVTNNFSSITSTETVYANREVIGDTMITYKGKSYKGYIIKCSLLNKLAVAIDADYFAKSMQRITNRALAKAAKTLAKDESGVFTTFIEDVFVPELGIVSSLMTKKDGSFFSKTLLTE
jgi:hypothetical protein